MTTLVDQLLRDLSGNEERIGQRVGVGRPSVDTALSAALPLLMAALANNSNQPRGAQDLHRALAEDHDGTILNELSRYLENPESANGAGILRHALGDRQPAVTDKLSQGLGLNPQQLGQLLQIAAPLIMGALGRERRTQGLNPNDLASMLGNQRQTLERQNPGLMSVLNRLLDRNQNGSALDDIGGILSQVLSRR